LPGGNIGIVFEKFILNIKVQGGRRLDASLRWQDKRRETRVWMIGEGWQWRRERFRA